MRGIRITTALAAGLMLALSGQMQAAGTSLLFIGNSFLFAYGSPARFYRASTVTDLNNEGIGGVPALVKSFTEQAGLDYDIALETRGGSGLDFHLEQKKGVIGRRGWDKVVMHGFSTLDAQKPRDPAKLIATTKEMADFLRAYVPDAPGPIVRASDEKILGEHRGLHFYTLNQSGPVTQVLDQISWL